MSEQRSYSDWTICRRLLREARPYWSHIAGIFLISLLATPVALLLPLPLKIAVDNVIGDEPLPDWLAAIIPDSMESSTTGLIVAVALMLVAITLLGELRTLAETVFGAYTGEKLLLGFRTKLFRQGQRLSLAYHDSVGTADSSYRIQYDSWSIRTIALSGITPLVTAVVMLAAMLFVIMRLDWQIGLVALAVTPLMFALTWLSRSRLKRGWRQAKEVESQSLSVIQEVLTSLRVVKAFGREDFEEGRFAGRASAGVNLRVRLTLLESGVGLALALVTAVGTGLVLILGVQHVEAGLLTLGSLLLIMGYLTQLYSPLRLIARQIGSLQAAFASGERALSLLDEAPDVPEKPGAVTLPRARGEFELRDVSFGYGNDPDVLSHVTLSVPAGARVGVAGVTGAGKTTLISLICRFYDPRSGTILLDGKDITDYRLSDLRNQYGIVLQEPVLFSTTIAENIAYARPEASAEEVEAAARAANAHEFIAELADGYDTLVGERGMRLSGGERQRISLARAFLKDAPILILDEPTSSVDTATEGAIIEAMDRLMSGRTTFMIAHRLSTLEGCDIRLKVGGGNVTQERRDVWEQRGSTPATEGVESISPADPDVDVHPALTVWRRIRPGATAESIETLKNCDAVVFRLRGAGPDGQPVIAKRRPASNTTEREFYTDLRHRLGLGEPQFWGIVDGEADGYSWLFLGDAGEERYDTSQPAHRLAAGRWLGSVHRESVRTVGSVQLPDRSSSAYLSYLRQGKEAIDLNFANALLSQADRLILDRAVRVATAFEDGWSRIESLCSAMPIVLVHGDLAVKNVRMDGPGSARFVAFDWGEAGWGAPAVDLAQGLFNAVSPSLEVYAAEMAPVWPGLGMDVVKQAADIGTVFRALAAISWAAEGLGTPWLEKPVATIAEAVATLSRFEYLVDGVLSRSSVGNAAQ